MSVIGERITILESAGFIDESGRRDIETIVNTLVRECGISRDNDLLAVLITHVASALKRVREGQPVEALSEDILDDIKGSPIYPEALRIQREILNVMEHSLPQSEEEFVLVHIGGLLISQQEAEKGDEKEP